MVVRSRRELYAVAGAALAAYLVWRPAMLRWGTQAGESTEPLPGDGLAPRPRVQSTRAITIDAPPGQVWPWIVQMGIGRAGFYTHDRVERLMSTPAEGGVRMSIVTGARRRPPPWSPWRPRADGTSIPVVVRSRLAVAAGIKAFHTLAWLSIESCVAYVLWAGFAGRPDRRAGVLDDRASRSRRPVREHHHGRRGHDLRHREPQKRHLGGDRPESADIGQATGDELHRPGPPAQRGEGPCGGLASPEAASASRCKSASASPPQ